MILTDFLPARPDERWALARQVGVTHAITKLHPDLTGENGPWDMDVLHAAKRRFEEAGFTLIGLEGDQIDMSRIKQGLPGFEEDLEQYRHMIRNMGELGIGLLCYNFMVAIGWFRSQTRVAERGGAMVTGFDINDLPADPPPGIATISEREVANNYERFIRAVLPVAEQAQVRMALHPDDPPVSPIRGIGRIFTSAEGIRSALSLAASRWHGVAFCQGTFATMGEDLPALAGEFAAREKLFFVHFRDVRGNPDRFVETFHDNGPTNMPAMIRRYADLGFDGPIRVDHVPTMAGEENAEPGYGARGRLFAVGYLKGILDALNIAHR